MPLSFKNWRGNDWFNCVAAVIVFGYVLERYLPWPAVPILLFPYLFYFDANRRVHRLEVRLKELEGKASADRQTRSHS